MSSKNANLEKLDELKKQLEKDNYKNVKIDKDYLFTKENGIKPINFFISKNLLPKVADILANQNQPISKKDIFPQSKNNPDLCDLSIINTAITTNNIDALNNALIKNNEKLSSNDFFVSGYDENFVGDKKGVQTHIETPFKTLITATNFANFSGSPDYKKYYNNISNVLQKNNDPFKANNFFDENSKPLIQSAQMIACGLMDEFVDICQKGNRNLSSKDMFTLIEGGTMFQAIVVGGRLNQTIELLEKQGEKPFTRKDIVNNPVRPREPSLVTLLVLFGSIEDVNDTLKKNNEKPLTIDDIPKNDEYAFSQNGIENLLGIKDFSDKPKQITNFWKNIPEELKTEENKKIYNQKLNDVSNIIITNKSKAR